VASQPSNARSTLDGSESQNAGRATGLTLLWPRRQGVAGGPRHVPVGARDGDLRLRGQGCGAQARQAAGARLRK
jgi:hypothetical protein